MTLIVGVVTEKFAFLVSDRRITWFDDRAEPVGFEDSENKAILLNGNFLMGYTGFARLGHSDSRPDGIETDFWTAEVLAHSQPEKYFVDLRDAISKEVSRIAVAPHLKGHAFLAVGYSSIDGRIVPTYATVSNALAEGYGTWKPTSVFKASGTGMPNADTDPPDAGRLLMAAVGIVPPKEIAATYVEQIQALLRVDDSKIVPCIEVVIEMVRAVAANEQGVGADVSISVLPRASVGSGYFMVSASGIADPIDEPIAGYAPAGSGVDSAKTYNPLLISPGMVIGGGETEFGAPED